MSFPTPKYALGDKVWTANISMKKVDSPCPDCMGSKKWEATSPAGESFAFDCPTCARTHDYTLRHQVPEFAIRQLTIGSVQINTTDEEPVRYMCHETGIGSGTLWGESKLSADEEGAKVIGRNLVAERIAWLASEIDRNSRNNGGEGTGERMRHALRYHTFTTREIAEAKSQAWRIGYKLENLCNAIAELDSHEYVEGLDSAMLDRIVNELKIDFATIGDARDAVMHARETARKAA